MSANILEPLAKWGGVGVCSILAVGIFLKQFSGDTSKLTWPQRWQITRWMSVSLILFAIATLVAWRASDLWPKQSYNPKPSINQKHNETSGPSSPIIETNTGVVTITGTAAPTNKTETKKK